MALSTLKFAPGLVMDDTHVSSEPYWAYGDRVRFVRGRPQTIGGWSRRLPDTLDGKCRAISAWINRTRDLLLALGTHAKLYVVKDGVLYDITPAGFVASGADAGEGGGYGIGFYGTGNYGESAAGAGVLRTWSLDHWGDSLLASPRGGTLYEWLGNTASPATAVATAPAVIDSFMVDPARYLVALGATDQGTGDFDPMLARWCDQDNYAVWAAASGNKAGQYPLTDGGRIVGGRPGSPSLIWTDTALYRMVLIDADAVFGFPPVASNCGLIAPNAVTERDGQAWWMGSNKQFHGFAGGAPEPLDCPLKDHVFNNVDYDQADKIMSGVNGRFNEVWWFYPDVRDGNECSRYVTFNTQTRDWSAGEMARSAWIDAGVTSYPIGVTPDGVIYDHEIGQSADGAAIGEELISGAIDLADGDLMMRVNGLMPDMKGALGEAMTGVAQVSVLMRDQPQGEEREFGPFAIDASVTWQPFQAQGRHARIKIKGASTPSFWRLGDPRWDLKPTGMMR